MDIEIPYTVKPRPDTGLYNGKLGTDLLNVPLATFNTVVLISSSMTMVMAWASLKLDDFGKYRKFIGATAALGVLFLLVKSYEYYDKFSHEHYPSTSTFYAIYFTITGLHVLHLLAGVLVCVYHGIFGGRMWKTEPERFTNRIEVTGLYWHFVDLVWLVVFPVLYLT